MAALSFGRKGESVTWSKKGRGLLWLFFALGKGAAVGGMIAWLFYRSVYGLVFLPLCMVVMVFVERKKELQRRREREQQQFVEYLGFLKEALQVGYSLEQAVGEAQKGMLTSYREEEPFLVAIARMQRKMQLGMSVEKAFSELAEESACEEVQDFTEVLFIAKRTGGVVWQVISNTEQVIRDKQETLRYIQSVLHGREYEVKVMKCMPFAMLLYMQMFLSDFLKPLYHNIVGVCVMTVVLAVYFGLCFVADRVAAVSL